MTDPLTYLDEVDARAEAATEGPWRGAVLVGDKRGYEQEVYSQALEETGEFASEIGPALDAADAEFIAHARQDLPALSKALRAVLAVVERAEQPLESSDEAPEGYWQGATDAAEYTARRVRFAIQAALAVNDEGGK